MINRFKELGFVLGFVILSMVAMGLIGGGTLIYKATLGVTSANIDREIYEESASHVKGVARDLSDYRYELTETENETERRAIINLINSRFADFNDDQLNDDELAQFLRDVRNGTIK